jgi:serine protease Do
MTKRLQFSSHKITAFSCLVMCLCFSVKLSAQSLPEPSNELIYGLKESIVKVNTTTKSGGHGFGTGVAISKDHVVTNCHVVQNSNGISISKWGTEYAPVSMQADWMHDLCVLKFEWADLKPVNINTADLGYEQPVISISMPTDSPAPYVLTSKIKALYPMDSAEVIRTEAAFSIGASGSPMFDYDGNLIAISTFKSPGKNAYFYNMSARWIAPILETPNYNLGDVHDLPFWDAPDEARPFFMQVVLPYQNARWDDVLKVALMWTKAEANNAEAWYYLGTAYQGLNNIKAAHSAYEKALNLHENHSASLINLALMAHQNANLQEVTRIRAILLAEDEDLVEALDAKIGAL